MPAKKSTPAPVGAPRTLENGKRVNVYLDDESLRYAADLGEGNVSSGVRLALKMAMAPAKTKKGT